MKLAHPFTTEEEPTLAQVGGKAMSLISMTRQGLPVPPGFVLTAAWFEPWLEYVQNTPEWALVLRSSPEDLKRNCDVVKSLCVGLEFDESHKEALAEALASLDTNGMLTVSAVEESTGKQASIRVEPPGGLTPEDIELRMDYVCRVEGDEELAGSRRAAFVADEGVCLVAETRPGHGTSHEIDHQRNAIALVVAIGEHGARHGGVGVGGRGGANVNAVARNGENIVALCDVDGERAGSTFEIFPKARK